MPASLAVPTIAPTRLRALALAGAVFVFFFAAYVLTASGDIFSQGDTTIRIELGENISGRLDLCLHGWKLQYPRHLKKEFLDPRVWKGTGGRTCSTYELGQPLAIIPFDWLGSRLAVHERWTYGPAVAWVDRLVGPLFGALEVLVFFVFCVRLGYGVGRSLLLSAILAFASSVWPDEQSVLEHAEVAFFLLWGMYFAYRFREQGAGWKYLLWTGAAIGGAAITRYQDAAIGVGAIALFLILPGGPAPGLLPRVRWLLLAGLGLLPFVLIDLWYSYARFGSPFASGHHETVFGYPIWLGALGLTVSPGKGLLWYDPLIFLLAIAGPLFFRRYRRLAIGCAAMAAGFILLYGYVTYWHGDPAWGPRYIYPIVPFLTLPLGTLLRFPGRWRRPVWLVMALVVLVSFTVQFAAVSVGQWRSWYRVISYEENHGYEWEWIAARYRYFWNVRESPLYFQLHGLYQLSYDTIFHSDRYVLVPPTEDPVLDSLATDFAVNQWYFWWTANEFNWWMGEPKVIEGVVFLVAIMLAAGTYAAGEASGVFVTRPSQRSRDEPVPEAA